VATPALADGSVFAGAAPRGGVPAALAEKVADALAASFSDQGVVSLAGGGGGGNTPRGDSAEQLERLLDDARGRYLEGNFAGAIKQAQTASKRFEEGAAFEANEAAWKVWSELMLVRALALGKNGKAREADRVLGALAAARPGYVPDPGLAPPKFASRYQQILAGLQNKKVSLKATSRPAGATVIVDGVEVGVTPWETSEALPGGHFVSLRLGDERHDEALKVTGKGAEVRAELGDPRREAAARVVDELSRGVQEAALVGAATDLGDDVLLGVIEPADGAFVLLVGHVRGGALISVTGARAREDLTDLATVANNLALTSFESDVDSWLDEGEPAEARTRFLGSPGASNGGDGGGGEEGGNLGLILGVTAGVVGAVVVAAAVTTGVVLYLNRPPNPGGIDVVVDASNL
jgi:hypothetical protein